MCKVHVQLTNEQTFGYKNFLIDNIKFLPKKKSGFVFGSFQSLGCLLFALCYYKSPFDEVYERGDSVALAAASGTLHFPQSGINTTFNDLISTMLVVDPQERPFISDVLQSIEALKTCCNL